MKKNIEQIPYDTVNRADKAEIELHSKIFKENKIIINIANSLSQMLIVLNKERQIIYSNKLFISFLGLSSDNDLIGKRPGEALNCIYAGSIGLGCGTTEFCKSCGALNAILESQTGKQSVKECQILTADNEAHDLKVTATPFIHNDYTFTIFAISDISNEKRRQTLERVFFHDVLNSAGGISGLSSILQEIDNPDDIIDMAKTINQAADNLISEIQSQRQLSAAERGDLIPETSEVNSISILKDLVSIYSKQEIALNINIKTNESSEEFVFTTDPVLLRRILGNMIKNALEASLPNSEVIVYCNKVNNKTQFSVHNSNYIERKIQLQLFKRSFSTKGIGRGIGTYSMKLLAENYLSGKVWFKSTRKKGTTFYLEIS